MAALGAANIAVVSTEKRGACTPVDTGPKKRLVLLAILACLSAVLFGSVATYRVLDRDEGFYLLAARLVYQHEALYRDFLHTQMPALAYIYGAWAKLAGHSYLAARSLSVLLATLLTFLVGLAARRGNRPSVAPVIAVALFACNTLTFVWMPLLKTYALSTTLLFGSYLLLTRGQHDRHTRVLLIGSGALFGLSMETRLYFVAVFPLFVLWIFREGGLQRNMQKTGAFAGGFLLAMLPAVWFVIADRDYFVFNVFGFHAFRSPYGLIGGIEQKVFIVIIALAGHTQQNGPQLLFLLAGTLSFLAKNRLRPEAKLALGIALVLLGVSLLPSPAYVQYFCVAVPFLALVTAEGLGSLIASGASKATRFSLTGLLAMYFLLPIGDYRRSILDGSCFSVEPAENWRPSNVTTVADTIDRLTTPRDTVLSFWPGYLAPTHAAPVPGLENDSGLVCAPHLTPGLRRRYHVLTGSESMTLLLAGSPRLVILGNEGYIGMSKRAYINALQHSKKYQLISEVGQALIYRRIY